MTIDARDHNAPCDVADPPFDHPDADLIVRSTSSNVDFPVIKAFLTFASPRWNGILSTYSDSQKSTQDMKGGLPVLPLEEDEETLETLLRLCYPPYADNGTFAPEFTTIQRAATIFEAARKYSVMAAESAIMQRIMRNFLETEPMRVFAFAWRFGMSTEMMRAAKETLRLPLLGREYVEEMEWISGGSYHRLQEYHVACGQAASVVAEDLQWLTKESFTWFECTDCARRDVSALQLKISGSRLKWVYARWWQDYMKAMKNALNDRPSRHTVQDPALVEEALRKACQSCGKCGLRAFKEMREFCTLLGNAVEEATDKVLLNIQL